MGYRLIAWDRQKNTFLKEFWLTDGADCFLGRHSDNHCVLDHAELAQFHFQMHPTAEGLRVIPIPGARLPRTPMTAKSLWIKFDPRQRNQKSRDLFVAPQGGQLKFENLVLEILGPHTLTRPRWSKPVSTPHPTPIKFIRSLQHKPLPVLGIGLLLFILLLSQIPVRPKHYPDQATEPINAPLPVTAPVVTRPSAPILPVETQPTPAKINVPRSPLEVAKNQFIDGKEQQAIGKLLQLFDENPFDPIGRRAGQLAKDLEQLRQKRQGILAMENAMAEGWQPLFEQEQMVLGKVSQKTREMATQKLVAHIQKLLNENAFPQSLKEIEILSKLGPNHPQAKAFRKQLHASAEKNFKRAYVLTQIDPVKAKAIFEETLTMVSALDPLHTKILEQLGKNKKSS